MIETTLGELLIRQGGSIKTGPFGTVLKASEYRTLGVPVISVGEVGYGEFRLHPNTPRVPPEVVERLPEYVLMPGDIVFGRKGAVDRSAWISEEQGGWFLGSDGIRLRLPPSVDRRFVAFQLQSPSVRTWLLQNATGSTMLSLSQGVLGRLPISLPSLAVQNSISALLAAIDDAIANNGRLIEIAENLARAKFTSAITNCAMSEKTFSDLAVIGGGGTPTTTVPEFWNGSIPWATPTDITRLTAPYLRSTDRSISKMGLSNSSAHLYPAGSILMTSRATIGAFALTEIDVAVNQGFIVVNAKDPNLQLWLYHEMVARVDEFKNLANGATFLELSRGRFKKLNVRLAGSADTERFNAETSLLHATSARLDRKSRALSILRDTLIPKLMSGQLSVRDAETQAEVAF